MFRFTNSAVTAALASMVLCASPAIAAPKGSGSGGSTGGCKGAKGTPVTVTRVTPTSARRIQIHVEPGTYNGGPAYPSQILVKDANGTVLTRQPESLYTGDSRNLLDTEIEGLLPGQQYRINVATVSSCIPAGADVAITMPPLSLDTTDPEVGAPYVQWYSMYMGSAVALQGRGWDNTAVMSITVTVDGQVIANVAHDINTQWFRYWNYGVYGASALNDLGPMYFAWLPDNVRNGSSHQVVVTVTDTSGRTTTNTSTLTF
jgi:hypothetical protein